MKHFMKVIGLAFILFSSAVGFAQLADLAPTPLDNNYTVDQLQQAATAGDPNAQYALGYMYYYGKNVQQDTTSALNWIRRAAVQGQQQAIQALSLLNQPLHPQDNINTVQNAVISQADAEPMAPVVKPQQQAKSVVTVPNAKLHKTPTAAPTHLSQAHPSRYTIQLLAAADKQALDRYVTKHKLHGKTLYGQTKHQGKSWYVLNYGKYPSASAAKLAMNTLPSELKAQNPWIKMVE
ncbi:MAG: SPOR domain-containing protein [Gammaproteobacteria bacterium]